MVDILLAIVIAVISAGLTVLFFSLIGLPIFYALPRAIWWSIKGRTKWSAPFAYSFILLIGIILLLGGSFLSRYFLPELTTYILDSFGLMCGVILGLMAGFFQFVTKKGRDDLNQDFLDRMAKKVHSKKP